jgi:hypothetical protein
MLGGHDPPEDTAGAEVDPDGGWLGAVRPPPDLLAGACELDEPEVPDEPDEPDVLDVAARPGITAPSTDAMASEPAVAAPAIHSVSRRTRPRRSSRRSMANSACLDTTRPPGIGVARNCW